MKSAFFLEHFVPGNLLWYLHALRGNQLTSSIQFPHLSHRGLLPESMKNESGGGISSGEIASPGQLSW